VYRVMIMEHINQQQELESRIRSLSENERLSESRSEEYRIKLSSEHKAEVIEKLNKDKQFLKEVGIEYCNLIVNYSNEPFSTKGRRHSGGMKDLGFSIEIRILNFHDFTKSKKRKRLSKSTGPMNKVHVDRLEETLNLAIE
jgi:hypothetical protein